MINDWQTKKIEVERDWLIEKHKPIVFYWAKKIAQSLPFPTEPEELIAYGQLGLVEAGERFDPSRGNNFSTFAHYRVKGAIYDGLREMGLISRSRLQKFHANANDIIMTGVDDFSVDHAPDVETEIENVENLIDALIPVYFLSIDEDDSKEIIDERAYSPADLEKKDLVRKIRSAIDELESEEAELLRKIYFKNMSAIKLAAEMGITKSWVSRLHARAVSHLQQLLITKGVLDSLNRKEKQKSDIVG